MAIISTIRHSYTVDSRHMDGTGQMSSMSLINLYRVIVIAVAIATAVCPYLRK